jgi:hypothetical protein
MAESNRVRLAYLDELTAGVVPSVTATNPLREIGFTSDALTTTAQSVVSETIRSDRMVEDLIRVMSSGGGSVGFELEFPTDRHYLSDFMSGAFYSPWFNTFNKFNNGTADSIITDVANTTNVITVDSTAATTVSAAIAIGHLVRNTGFTQAANNGRFRCSAATATTATFAGAGFALEASVAATARMKVVGFQGVAGDLVAAVGPNRLTSTALDFTALGLAVGSFVKIGGPIAGEQFTTAANNGWARISAIAPTALTFDIVPPSWSADTGVGRTISVYIPDRLRNGTTRRTFVLLKDWLDVLQYSQFPGIHVGEMSLDFVSGQIVKGAFTMNGFTEVPGVAAPLGTPTPSPLVDVLSAAANVARPWENGSAMPTDQLCRSLRFRVNNGLQGQSEIGNAGYAGFVAGQFTPTVDLELKFLNKGIYERFLANTPSSLFWRSFAQGQGLVLQLPRMKYGSGGIPTPGPNQAVYFNCSATGLVDPITGAAAIIDRFPEFA